MSDCNHIIGHAELEDCGIIVHADSKPDIIIWEFTPYTFCPKCGVKLTDEPANYAAALEKAREEYRARIPDKSDAFVRESSSLEAAIKRLTEPSSFAERLRKEPLPEGMGFNWATAIYQRSDCPPASVPDNLKTPEKQEAPSEFPSGSKDIDLEFIKKSTLLTDNQKALLGVKL
jgi:hypothetical protein